MFSAARSFKCTRKKVEKTLNTWAIVSINRHSTESECRERSRLTSVGQWAVEMRIKYISYISENCE